MNPLVSVVMPTRNRQAVAMIALKSVIGQNYKNMEIIVIIDGKDEDTLRELKKFDDDRIYIYMLDKPLGGAGARNCGIEKSRGEYIAFIDDDDEWLPGKIELQIESVDMSSRFQIISHKVIAKNEFSENIWPVKNYLPNDDLSEYMFVRDRLFRGERFIQTSTLMFSRAILEKMCFDSILTSGQESDLILRASKIENFRFCMLTDVLSIWNYGYNHKSITRESDWEGSLSWAMNNRDLLTKKSFADYMLTVVASKASRKPNLKRLLNIIYLSGKYGVLRPKNIVIASIMHIFNEDARHKLKKFMSWTKK